MTKVPSLFLSLRTKRLKIDETNDAERHTGLAMAQKKYGKGGPVDKQKNEKITDFIRKAFEKVFKYVAIPDRSIISLLSTVECD